MLCLWFLAMNAFVLNPRTKAFTLVELLVVIAIIGILAAILMPVLSSSQRRAQRIWCESNLHQTGLAYHTFATDHGSKFPMSVSTNEGGSLEYIQNGYYAGGTFYTAYRTFQALSGDLIKPELLVCSTDTARAAATNFTGLQNSNVSYFVGANGTFDKPGSILAGDRNLATNLFTTPTILQLSPWSRLHWTMEMHQFKGNVLFADGHVEEWNDPLMLNAEKALPDIENLFLPSVVATANGTPGWNTGYSSGSPYNGYSSPQSQSTMPSTSSSQSRPMPQNHNANSQSYVPPSQPAGREESSAAQGNPETPGEVVGAAVPVDDTETGMTAENRHLTKVLQHTFEWLYLLLLLLLLLYLIYKLRKWMREREAKQKARQMRRRRY